MSIIWSAGDITAETWLAVTPAEVVRTAHAWATFVPGPCTSWNRLRIPIPS